MGTLNGVKWGKLTQAQKETLLSSANCVDGVTGNTAYNGECIVDLTDKYSIVGFISDGEIKILDDAIIYCPASF